MNLEELIYSRLKSTEGLTGKLTKYNGEPAIFYQKAPEDTQEGWQGTSQYPRIVFDLDKHSNSERKSQGTLIISILCDRSGTEPETIEPIVTECLKNVLLKPEGAEVFAFAWAKTVPFEVREKVTTDLRVIGQEVTLDILELPSQVTTDPDPVDALNAYMHKIYPEAIIVGLTEMEEITEADPLHPVLYCRLQSCDTVETTNTVVWMQARMSVHVICPDSGTRMRVSQDIANHLVSDAEIIMLDYSPMRPGRISTNHTVDYLMSGQISGSFDYGILRYRPKQKLIAKVKLSSE